MEYDHIDLVLQKGQKAEIKAHAAAIGESVNSFIVRAINETMKREAEDRDLAELRLAIGQLDLESYFKNEKEKQASLIDSLKNIRLPDDFLKEMETGAAAMRENE